MITHSNINPFYENERFGNTEKWALPACLVAVYCGWLIAGKGFTAGMLLTVFPFAAAFLILTFLYPRFGYITFIIYCFLVPGLGRHIEGPQFGLGQDGMLLLTWLGIIFHRGNRYRFKHLNNDLVWMAVVWFIITVLEIINPERPQYHRLVL